MVIANLKASTLIVLKEEPKNALDDLHSSSGVVVSRNGEQLYIWRFCSPAVSRSAGDIAY
jgi:hypothetical protein